MRIIIKAKFNSKVVHVYKCIAYLSSCILYMDVDDLPLARHSWSFSDVFMSNIDSIETAK